MRKWKKIYNVDVAARYFSKKEQETLHSLITQDRTEAFYRIWARKEAVIKARGQGLLTSPISSFSVSMEPVTETLHILDQTWHLAPLLTNKCYQAAIATKYPLDNIIYYAFDPCKFLSTGL